MTDVYLQIFDYAKNIMNESGGDFRTTRRAYSYWLSEASDVVDVEKLLGLDKRIGNVEFMQICYFAILDRAVDDSIYNYWGDTINRDQGVFRVKLLRKVLYSPEAVQRGKRVINNSNNIRIGYIENIGGRILTFAYFKIFLNMPKWFQRIVKRIAGK